MRDKTDDNSLASCFNGNEKQALVRHHQRVVCVECGLADPRLDSWTTLPARTAGWTTTAAR
jgi:hypothetical protein